MRYEFEVDLKPVWHRLPSIVEAEKPRVPPIRRTLVLAYQIADYMAAHKIETLPVFSKFAHVSPARISQILNLTRLSPRIQEEILTSDRPELQRVTEIQVRPIVAEVFWPKQEELWKTLNAAGQYVVMLTPRVLSN